MRSAAAVWAAAALAALAAGCGGRKAPDLFLLTRTGAGPYAHLTMLVNEEGGVRCNGSRELKLGDPQIVQARVIQEQLHDPASNHLILAPRPGSVLSYRVRDVDGEVRFADNSAAQPAVLRQLVLFVLQTAQQVCHLPE
jgi:hypothetical protein